MDTEGISHVEEANVSVSNQGGLLADGGVVEETNRDLLKNTPANIQRLEDEIEQYEGRQKYLAQTRSPSDGGDVRWYFCKVPLRLNELAASVPCSEIVGKGEYFRFGMRDSLAIEASFLQREEELLSYWWKEYAECSEGPKGQPISTTETNFQLNSQSELYSVEEERVGVSVKGGLYEVDLLKRHCYPVYWNGENRRVLRGHWFAQSQGLDWLPLREDVAEQLEFAYHKKVWHRRTFQPSGLFAARLDLQGSAPGMHALFTGEDDTWEAWLNVDASGFSSFVSLGGNGIKLRRGYAPSLSPRPTQDELRQQKEEQMDDYCSQVPVRHLVFMVHGIGQRLEKSNLVDDVTNFRYVTSILAEKHLTSHQLGSQRVLLIPCQWRKGLKLSGESAVDSITLDGVRGLRTMLSATAHDILYYMSPIYCQDIIDSVSNQLNRLYLKFLKRNPGYDGKVSLYGHSLGSVLSYDILCHQKNLSSPFRNDWICRKVAREDGLSSNITKLSSEQESKTDGTEASQEASNDVKLGRQDVPPNLENTHTKDPQPISDHCPNYSSFRENDFSEERDGEMQTGNSLSPKNDYFCNPGMGVMGDASVNNHENMDALEEKSSLDGILQPDIQEKAVKDKHSPDTTDEEKSITDLMLEVDFLKARLRELETQPERHDNSGDQDESRNISTGKDDSPQSYKPFIKYKKLEFQIDTFFAVGSPLGVFLALRNVRIGIGGGREYWAEDNITEEMPACRRMFNIFHPFDPVAYRVEPLICKEYITKRPVIVPYHKGGKRLHIGFQEFKEDLAARSQSIMNHLDFVKVKMLTICQSRKKEDHDEGVENVVEEVRSYGSFMMERLTGSQEGRIDHVLQDETFQHPYISAIGSHTNYWKDYDTALFILKHLYEDIPEEAGQPIMNFNAIKNDSTSTGRSDVTGSPDEELPLTFSNPALIRRYCKKT